MAVFFASRTVHGTSRFFVAKASPGRVRSPRAFALGHSPHLSAGGARLATGSDVPCRPNRRRPELPPPTRARRRSPEGARRRDDRPDQNRSHDRGLTPPCSRSKTPSTGSIRTSRSEVGPRSSTLSQLSRAPGTPFRLPQLPACHGDGPPREVTRLRATIAEATPTRGREDASFPVSATDLLSTDTLQLLQLPSIGLAPDRPSLVASALPPNACTGFGTRASTLVPTNHKV